MAITFGIIPSMAQEVAKIHEVTERLQILSESAMNNINVGNMKQAVHDYKEIMSVLQGADTLSVWLPFYVNDEIHEPVIRYYVHQNYEEAIKMCDFYLEVIFYKIKKWFEDGYIETTESFISNISFQYTKLAHWFTEESLYGDAERYHSNAVSVFENAKVYSKDYADELWDMANFQQLQKNDYLKSLQNHYKSFKVLVELYGIESEEAVEAFGRMSTVYSLSIPDLSLVLAKEAIFIPEYEIGKEILNFWRKVCSEIKDNYGDNAFIRLKSMSWDKSLMPNLNHSFKNRVDSIRYGMSPFCSYEAEIAQTYYVEANLNIIYEDNLGFHDSISNAFSYSLSEDEFVACIMEFFDILDESGYVYMAMDVLASGITVLSNYGKRYDLVEYLSSRLAPLAVNYNSSESFTMSAICIYPLLFDGSIRYFDVENYLNIIGAALKYYDRDSTITDRLCSAADSLVSSHGNEISSGIKEMINARIADIQSVIGDKQKKLEYLNKAIYWQQILISELIDGTWDKNPKSPQWPAFAYTELALLYGRKGDYDTQKDILKKCLIYYKHNDPNNVNQATIYSELVWNASKSGDILDLEKYSSDWLYYEANEYLSKSFSMLKRNRIYYYYNTVLPVISEIIVQESLNGADLAGLCYNASLYMKGFLLNQERTIYNNVSSCSDSVLLALYEKYSGALVSGGSDVDKYEYDLMHQYFLHPEFRNTSIIPNWQDVANALDKDAIAIEFLVGEYLNAASYVALILKKGWDKPLIVKIADKKTIDSLYVSGPCIYEPGTNAYSTIWGSIEPFLKGVKSIYFSPYKTLCQMNIEALHNDRGVPLNKKYEIHRLSSTYLLCEYDSHSDEDESYHSACLFGGLNYNTDTTYLKEQNEVYFRSRDIFEFTDLNMQTRKGWGDLPATKREVERIKGILAGDIKVELYEGDEGTESAFKSYNGQSPSIIHISTHGFYLEQTKARRIPMFESFSESSQYIEPMKRSGLVFSGGQHAWLGNPIPENIEDGILTAEEVSGMDLSKTKLLVLAACQTGLGDISGEGVYGLQRGFKLAGVETIIMSLWRVNDAMTELLMTTFYTSLINGKSKYESFQDAVDKVRKENHNPEYWAAFIMLD